MTINLTAALINDNVDLLSETERCTFPVAYANASLECAGVVGESFRGHTADTWKRRQQRAIAEERKRKLKR